MSEHGVTGRCPAASARILAAALAALASSPPALGARAAPAAVPTRDADCLAEAVWYEAGGERRAGQEAVAEVVLNRLRDPVYPKTVCGVVFQGAWRTTGCQFTFTCDGSRGRRPPDPEHWREAEALAADALAGRLAQGVGASTHYHALWAHPAWSAALTPTLRIGGHQFYAGSAGRVVAAGAVAPPAPASPRAGAFSVWGLQVAVVTPPGPNGATAVSAP